VVVVIGGDFDVDVDDNDRLWGTSLANDEYQVMTARDMSFSLTL
jgi:hypothetical protein